MSRSGLKFTAVVLSLLIVAVLFAGLDDLPRGLRKQIDSERTALASAQSQVQTARAEVGRSLATEAALFSGIAESRTWPARFDKAGALLQSAGRDMEALTRLEKENRRTDRERVERLLSEERGYRASAAAEASSVRKEAAHWIDLKQHLPQAVQQMEKDYRAIRAVDLSSAAADAEKAGRDWPEKKADLDARMASARALADNSERAWETSAAARQEAASGNYANLNYAVLLGAADALSNSAAELPRKAGELKSLSAQLYDSWDKVLVDMDTRGIGRSKEYDQKIRKVTVHVPAPASSQDGTTTSEERWVTVPRSTFEAMQNNLGMAIEHKPAGKYDSEAERTAQPAGFAYVAPPSQGSNQYGRWERRDGRDFWVFYGQYALLRDLLFNRDYRPLDRGDWDGYRNSRSRGETYYGRDTNSGQKYGTQGATTKERYSGSSYAERGGFKDSKYASKSGSYRDSQYSTPAQRNPDVDRAPRTFGRERGYAPPPSRTYRPSPSPSPRPSFHFPSGSGSGRRFGRR